MKNLFALMLIPNFLFAGWTVGYTAVDFDDVVDLGALYASYTWQTSDKVEVELGLGVGVTDDSADYVDSGVSVSAIAELDPSLLIRGKYLVNENFFVGLSAGRIEATGTAIACAGGTCLSESVSESDFDVGIGAGFRFGKDGAFSVSFDSIADTQLMSLGYSF
tara:strand:- start:449 stop:937 length:489 start_codon:yes stop_codon:yes gene_type:complete